LALAAAQYVLANGLIGLSLRPLAKALGTSARMLIYHFGSREGLMREVLEVMRRGADALVSAWYGESERPPSLAEFFEWLWRTFTTAQMRQTTILSMELYALALREPKAYPGVLNAPLAYWRSLARKSRARADAAEVTLMTAVTRGLLIDLAATGERRRVEQAVKRFVAMLKADQR
jgi:AcrR family transcriptional regulator